LRASDSASGRRAGTRDKTGHRETHRQAQHPRPQPDPSAREQSAIATRELCACHAGQDRGIEKPTRANKDV
jgi:hypothetical protein